MCDFSTYCPPREHVALLLSESIPESDNSVVRHRVKHVLHTTFTVSTNPFLVFPAYLCCLCFLPTVIFVQPHYCPVDAGCLKGMFICGLLLQLLYFWHYSLWILFYPCLIQLTLMAYLVALGLRFDRVLEGSSAAVAEGGLGGSSQYAGPPQQRV